MEQMIIAMIYLYPGALVDILRRVFFKRTYRDEETSDSTRAAKHFVFSTMISVASLLIYGRLAGKSVANPADLLNTFSATMEIPRFFLISLGMTVLFSCALEGLEEGYAKLRSLRLKETEQMKIDRSADTWHTLVYSKDFEYARSALVLRIKSGAGEQELRMVADCLRVLEKKRRENEINALKEKMSTQQGEEKRGTLIKIQELLAQENKTGRRE